MSQLTDTALNLAGQTNIGKSITSIGSSAASGAAIGSVVPGVGTLIGGLVGGIGSLFSSIFSGGGPSLQDREAREQGRVNALPKNLQDKYYSNKESVWAHQKEAENSYNEYLWGHRGDPNFKPDPFVPYKDPNEGKDYIDVLEAENGSPAPSQNTIPGQNNLLDNILKLSVGLLASSGSNNRMPSSSIVQGGELPGGNNALPNSSIPVSNFNSGSQVVSVKSPYALLVIGIVVVGGIYFYKRK